MSVLSAKTGLPGVQSVYNERLAGLKNNLSLVIRGKSGCIDIITLVLLAGGSVLIEDVPGVGKTTLAKALAKSIDADFNRIQCTPDLLPADILGSSVYNPVTGAFIFRKGPVFCNILLADEINRASPRTQSALLEAMNEMQVTIEGNRYPLPAPFMVLATQNPVEFHGTYPLPEAQLDRFLVILNIGYPDPETESEIFYLQVQQPPVETLKPVLSREDVHEMQKKVRTVRVDESISGYIVKIVTMTRMDSRLKLGVSPRGSLMMFRMSQAAAFLDGRQYVIPDDVKKYAPYILPHRIILSSDARYGGVAKSDIIKEILEEVRVPT